MTTAPGLAPRKCRFCGDGISYKRAVVGFGFLPLYLSTHNVINTHIDPKLLPVLRLRMGLLVCWCHKSQTRENRSGKDNSSVALHCYKQAIGVLHTC